ncbi:DMT family transporter [Actibacterium ureilyticum]|uniref:DMT family transporter n=1 Tax=Actibacterium ureilyticum TaxID=1590614 RepID=UPI000BAAED2A|nr:DMT family transporter [Actibacterium ureilyticum]
MRLLLLGFLTMSAFAANSLLNRAALSDQGIGPAQFASIRLAAGAAMLLILLALRERRLVWQPRADPRAVAGLWAYMLGFSFAYVSLPAGLGALILFGGVQITMFGGAVLGGERAPLARWLGAAISLGGLGLLFAPGAGGPISPVGAGLMALAAIGWGVYSLRGRVVRDPLAATSVNFVWALLASLPVLALYGWDAAITPRGVALAVISGAVTSGMGYALWYAILPPLGATRGALAQLSVPVIALAAGWVFLAEPVGLRAVLAALLVLGGVAVGLAGPYFTSRSSGS